MQMVGKLVLVAAFYFGINSNVFAAGVSVCIVTNHSSVVCDGQLLSMGGDSSIEGNTVALKKLLDQGYKIVSQNAGSWTLVK